MSNLDPAVLNPENWEKTGEGFALKAQVKMNFAEMIHLQNELGANNTSLQENPRTGKLSLIVKGESPQDVVAKIEQHEGHASHAHAAPAFEVPPYSPHIPSHAQGAGSGFEMPSSAMGGQHHGTNFGNHQFNDPRIGGSQYMHIETHAHGAPGMPPGRIDQTSVERAYKME